MEWYWWVLIVIVLVAGATIKLKLLGKLLENRKKREEQLAEQE